MDKITFKNKGETGVVPINSTNLNLLQDNVESAISDNTTLINELKQINVYSTDEQVIGTWIDGKPIYRRILNSISITSTNDSIDLSNLNIDTIVSFNPYLYKDTNPSVNDDFDTNYKSSDTDYFRCFIRNNSTLEIRWANDTFTEVHVSMILEYTKTTD